MIQESDESACWYFVMAKKRKISQSQPHKRLFNVWLISWFCLLLGVFNRPLQRWSKQQLINSMCILVYMYRFAFFCVFSLVWNFGPLFRHQLGETKSHIWFFFYILYLWTVWFWVVSFVEKNEICFVSKVYFLVFGSCVSVAVKIIKLIMKNTEMLRFVTSLNPITSCNMTVRPWDSHHNYTKVTVQYL